MPSTPLTPTRVRSESSGGPGPISLRVKGRTPRRILVPGLDPRTGGRGTGGNSDVKTIDPAVTPEDLIRNSFAPDQGIPGRAARREWGRFGQQASFLG